MSILGSKSLTGWGVVREAPWHFVGLFETQIQATAKAIDMGPSYAAHFGETTSAETFVWGLGDELT